MCILECPRDQFCPFSNRRGQPYCQFLRLCFWGISVLSTRVQTAIDLPRQHRVEDTKLQSASEYIRDSYLFIECMPTQASINYADESFDLLDQYEFM